MTIRVAVVATLAALHWDGHWLTHVTIGPAYWHRRQRFFSAFLRSSTIFINVHCVVFGPVGNVFVPFEYANDIWIVRRFQFASPVDLHSKLSFWRIDGYPTGLRTVSRLLVLVIRPLLRQIGVGVGVGIGEWRLPLRMAAFVREGSRSMRRCSLNTRLSSRVRSQPARFSKRLGNWELIRSLGACRGRRS